VNIAGFMKLLHDCLAGLCPIESFREQEPEDYEALMRRAGFLCVRAVKRE
jgi:hypothetical protein